MTTPSNDFDGYLPVYNAIPEEWEDSRQFLTERLREITDSVNARDFAEYIDKETLTGQIWLPGTELKLRDGFRKVVDVAPLIDFGGGGSSMAGVPHGITTSENTCITRLYGAASNPGASTLTMGIPLPYVDMPGDSDHIGLSVDATNIIISGAGDYSAYTCVYVVIEWIDEA